MNEVCDILLHWIATRDWKAAFYAVIPPRKFETGKKAEKLRKRKERRSINVGCEGNSDGGDSGVDDEAPEEGEPSSNTDEEGSKQVSTIIGLLDSF